MDGYYKFFYELEKSRRKELWEVIEDLNKLNLERIREIELKGYKLIFWSTFACIEIPVIFVLAILWVSK